MQILLTHSKMSTRQPRRQAAPQAMRLWARRIVQKRVVLALRVARLHHTRAAVLAELLGLNVHTVEEWGRQWKKDRLKPVWRGRKPGEVDEATRWEIEATLLMVTPWIGEDSLAALYPNVPKNALVRLLHQTRAYWTAENHTSVCEMTWAGPGCVWAIDFTETPIPIDGVFPYLLVVRDLASGMELLSLPVRDMTALTVILALRMLFAAVGAPLVLKSDNGSGFIAGETAKLLALHQVISLFSPPATPEYNGAVESGCGSIKTWTHVFAAQNGRPEAPTSDDVEGARLRNNELGRPAGKYAPTPDAAWQERKPISVEDRKKLRDEIARLKHQIRNAENIEGRPTGKAIREDDLNRIAISRALQNLEILNLRRRRLSQRLNPAIGRAN